MLENISNLNYYCQNENIIIEKNYRIDFFSNSFWNYSIYLLIYFEKLLKISKLQKSFFLLQNPDYLKKDLFLEKLKLFIKDLFIIKSRLFSILKSFKSRLFSILKSFKSSYFQFSNLLNQDYFQFSNL